MRGHIKQFSPNAGLGLIHPDDGKGDLRFLRTSLVSKHRPKRNDLVEFDVVYGPKGPEAVDVRPL